MPKKSKDMECLLTLKKNVLAGHLRTPDTTLNFEIKTVTTDALLRLHQVATQQFLPQLEALIAQTPVRKAKKKRHLKVV